MLYTVRKKMRERNEHLGFDPITHIKAAAAMTSQHFSVGEGESLGGGGGGGWYLALD